MRTIDMDCFDRNTFLKHAADAVEIRLDEDQFAFIRADAGLSLYITNNPQSNSCFFMGAKLIIRQVTEDANRVISFLLYGDDPVIESEPEAVLPFKLHMQKFRHDPNNGINGDCTRAVIASLLNTDDVEDVPHFGEGLDFTNDCNAPEFERRIDEYLATKQIKKFRTAYTCTLDELHDFVLRDNVGVPIIVDGISPRGTNHSVIYYNNKLAHDPHPDGGGIVGRMDNGQLHVTVLVSVPHIDERFLGQ